jgi:hypothetical protein
MADESQICFPAFVPNNAPRQSGDGSHTDDDPNESHAHISLAEYFSAMIGDYWMRSLERVQNETTAVFLIGSVVNRKHVSKPPTSDALSRILDALTVPVFVSRGLCVIRWRLPNLAHALEVECCDG